MKSQGIRLVRVALVRIGERFDLFNAELDDQSFPQRLEFSPGKGGNKLTSGQIGGRNKG